MSDQSKSLSKYNWPVIGGNQKRSAFRPNETVPRTEPKKLWEHEISKLTSDFREVVTDEELLYIINGSSAGDLIAIDKKTGKRNWKQITEVNYSDARGTNTPIITDKEVILLKPRENEGYDLCTLDKNTGKIQSKYELETDATGLSAPLMLSDRIVYVITPCGSIKAIDIDLREKIWDKNIFTDSTTHHTTALHDNKIYYGNYDGRLVCIDLKTKNVVWKLNKNNSIRGLSAKDNKLYVAFGGGNHGSLLKSYDNQTGEKSWEYSLPGTPSYMASNHNFIYVGTNSGTIHSFDENGEQWWEYQTDEKESHGWLSRKLLPDYRIHGPGGPPTVADGIVLFGGGDGKIYAVDAKKGDLLWKKKLCSSKEPRWGIRSQPVVDDGIIYIHDFSSTKKEIKEGFVYALDASI